MAREDDGKMEQLPLQIECGRVNTIEIAVNDYAVGQRFDFAIQALLDQTPVGGVVFVDDVTLKPECTLVDVELLSSVELDDDASMPTPMPVPNEDAGTMEAGRLSDGQACEADSQCLSGFCVDGVCCVSACTGKCEACNVAQKEGSCVVIKGAPVGKRAPCVGEGSCQGTCDGETRDTCKFPQGSEAPCGAAARCDGNFAVARALCDGKGACSAPERTDCEGFSCDSQTSACSQCKDASQCGANQWCRNGRCESKLQNGAQCFGNPSCESGHCASGVCCNAPCTGPCETCSASGVCGVRCVAPQTCGGGGASNMCGCSPLCSGKCGGADGCGGTCPNTCAAPQTCSGGGTPNVCGCAPNCAGKCGGSDGCGGACPNTCVAPQKCGGGGTANLCGCTPDCAGKCGGSNGCGGTCPNACVAPQTCGGGGTPNACGCPSSGSCTTEGMFCNAQGTGTFTCANSGGCVVQTASSNCTAAPANGHVTCQGRGMCGWECNDRYEKCGNGCRLECPKITWFPASFGCPVALSDDGQIVVSGGATVWTRSTGQYTQLATPAGKNTIRVLGISGNGSVIVGQAGEHAYKWEGGVATNLLPVAASAVAVAASRTGSIVVGTASYTSYRWGTSGTQIVDQSTAVDVTADGSIVVGTKHLGGNRVYRWSSSSGNQYLPITGEARAHAVNEDGSIILASYDFDQRLVLWSSGTVQELPGIFAVASNDDYGGADISGDGKVVLGTVGVDANAEPALWTSSTLVRPLSEVLGDAGVAIGSGNKLTTGNRISRDGRVVVGCGTLAGATRGYRVVLP